MTKKVPCPRCNSKADVLEIIYGYLNEKGMKLVDEKKAVSGGCCISGNDPDLSCQKCEIWFRGKDKKILYNFTKEHIKKHKFANEGLQ